MNYTLIKNLDFSKEMLVNPMAIPPAILRHLIIQNPESSHQLQHACV